MNNKLRLNSSSLLKRCDAKQLSFTTTDELKDLGAVIGQSRAMDAINFGISIDQEGYNLFAVGSSSIAKLSVIRQKIEEQAINEPTPADWCYINNFEEPNKPLYLKLPAGRGVLLRKDFDSMVEALSVAIAAVFKSTDYQNRKKVVQKEYKEQRNKIFDEIRSEANKFGIELLQTSDGLLFTPLRNGIAISAEEFEQLPLAKQREIENQIATLQDSLSNLIEQLPQLEKECLDKIEALIEEITSLAVKAIIDDVKKRYVELPLLIDYLDLLQKDVIKNANIFLDSEEDENNENENDIDNSTKEEAFANLNQSSNIVKHRYQINVIVDNSNIQGAPVIYEDSPAYPNLIGKIEHISYMGSLLADFTLIKAGSLHKANGGYLMIDAHKLLTQPYAWQGLKRALRAGKIQIESLEEISSIVSTVSLEPTAIPLNVKIILLGDALLYYLLYQNDPEFKELFKVMVDFNDYMERNADNQLLYARLLASLARKEHLHPLDRHAVARVIEYSSRMVGDAEKLSMHIKTITDLLREADYFANQCQRKIVLCEDIQQAINAQEYRANKINELTQADILSGTVLIDTEGEKIGQINGLAVFDLGNYSFGRPCRITATARVGSGEVIDIEREVELGGPIHSKGVMILSGYLASHFLPDQLLTLSARIVFEQSYSAIEGDSASSAELYALLSALANLPIKQSLAVTGSVNQHGQIQPIGGVNEKIEGFYDICLARGLTGQQGVLIPATNVKHLMLKQSVVDAVAAEKFHIYAVETINQGIELLTGVAAGERDKHGKYPINTVNYLVETRLTKMVTNLMAFRDKFRSIN